MIRQSDFYLIPNILSIARVIAIPIIIGLLYFQWNLLALLTFILVGVSDYVDGWIARKYHVESKLGALLDPLADKLIILSTMILLLWLGRLDVVVKGYSTDLIGPILVIVTVGREMAIMGLRAIASSAGISVPVDKGGKIKTTIQFVSISCLLVGSFPFLEIGQGLLVVSVIAALWSAIRYVLRFIKGLPA